MISRIRAQNIAADWHGGQGSALYAISCGNWDKLTPADYSRALLETVPERGAILISGRTERDKGAAIRDLDLLADFLEYKRNGN